MLNEWSDRAPPRKKRARFFASGEFWLGFWVVLMWLAMIVGFIGWLRS